MSSILKAIRKVEEEKRAASHAAPDLRLDQGATVHVKKSFGPLFSGMILGAFCVGLFLYVTSGPEVVPQTVEQPPAEKVIVASSSPEPAQAKPAIETIPVVTLPPEPVSVASPLPEKKPVVVPAAKATSKPLHSKSTPVFNEKKQPIKVTSVKKSKPLVLPEHINIKVTDIFYQDDPTNSMAVVNDLPVMVGTPVDGALVQEIHSDHIVFRVDGTDYPVYLPKQ